jgi:cell division protein FtsB
MWRLIPAFARNISSFTRRSHIPANLLNEKPMTPEYPDDGRYLDQAEELPFFSMRLRLPRWIDLAAIVIIGAGCSVFYHSYIAGSHGMMAERAVEEERDLLKGQSAALDRRIADQANLNRRLSDTYLDLDLLEERARALLGYVHARDVLIKE